MNCWEAWYHFALGSQRICPVEIMKSGLACPPHGDIRGHLAQFFPPLVKTDPAEGVGAQGTGKAEGFRSLKKPFRIPFGPADPGKVLRPQGQHIHGPQDLFMVADDKGVSQFSVFLLPAPGWCP